MKTDVVWTNAEQETISWALMILNNLTKDWVTNARLLVTWWQNDFGIPFKNSASKKQVPRARGYIRCDSLYPCFWYQLMTFHPQKWTDGRRHRRTDSLIKSLTVKEQSRWKNSDKRIFKRGESAGKGENDRGEIVNDASSFFDPNGKHSDKGTIRFFMIQKRQTLNVKGKTGEVV